MSRTAVCVFCGSKEGTNPIYRDKAIEVAEELAQRGLAMVYGGGSIGLMGVMADRLLELKAEIIGVIPQYIDDIEVAHRGVKEMILVDSMYQRKEVMERHSHAFFALPGGYGTFDEIFEFLALAQLGQHTKPMVLYNFNGFFDPLIAQVDLAIEEGFIKPKYRPLLIEAKTLEELFAPIAGL